MSWITGLLLAAAIVVSSVRWLRVAQREHYLSGSVVRFALRWFLSRPENIGVGVVLIALAVAGIFVPAAWIGAAAAVVVWPLGLGLRGRTSKLAWTRRLKTLAATSAALAVVLVAVAAIFGLAPIALVALAIGGPVVVDGALALLQPVERRLLGRFVTSAQQRLKQVAPTTIAITGSFGKTSTKQYAKALLAQQFEVCASPASFNNLAGLSRTINEHLHPGAELFIAEMGTYGPGEIRELCAWIRPRISVITAIGPVHLERMGSLDGVLAAKSEILDTAEVAVLNVDDDRLAKLADDVESKLKVIRCGTGERAADVRVRANGDDVTIDVGGREVEATVPVGIHLSNLACAIGAATAAGLVIDRIPVGISQIESPEHRGTVETTASGIAVIDDTFNSNPSGARAALGALQAVGASGTRVLVSPGMVELGREQARENELFAREATEVVNTVVIVGRTNRAAMRRGVDGTAVDVVTVEHREDAVAWVREHLGAGDAVLYENDLPDHFP